MMNEIYKKFGALLKLERQRRKLELADVSQDLKISEVHLEAIEAGEPEHLPGELYFNLFAKSYAELLGIDFNRTLEAIREDIGEPLEEETAEAPASPAPKQTDRSPHKAAAAGTARPSKEAPPETEKPPSPYKWLFITLYAVVGAFALFLVAFFVFIHKSPGERSMENLPEATGSKSSVSDTAQAANTEYARYNWKAPAYESAGPLKLALVARQESWATVLADGDTILFRTLIPGHRYDVEAKYRLLISITHPTVVDVTLNGQSVDLRNPETQRVSRVDIDQANVGEYLNIADSGNTVAIDSTRPPVKPRTRQATDTGTIEVDAPPPPDNSVSDTLR